MVRNPVTTQAPISKAGESTSRAISAETRKIPEPIIEPMTSMVELVRPRPLTNSRSLETSMLEGIGLASTLNQNLRMRGGQLRPPSPGRGRPGLHDFTPEFAKILLLICGAREPDRILPPQSRRR